MLLLVWQTDFACQGKSQQGTPRSLDIYTLLTDLFTLFYAKIKPMNHRLPVSGSSTLSYRRHRRQFAGQILLPLLVFVLLALGLAGFLVWGSLANVRHLADVALIWLITPLLVIGLIVIIIGGIKIYALARVLKTAPVYTAKAQQLFFRLTRGIQSLADKAVLPIFKINQVLAVLQALKRK